MMDERLYRETFSRLRASDEAKKEVLVKMNETKKTTRRPLKALRAVAMAAVLTLALAVTANAASNGLLLGTGPTSCWKTTRGSGWMSSASSRTPSSRTGSSS